MAKDSDGTQNQPLFSETGAPQLGTDLSLVSNYAALVGNRKVGTTAQRTALTGADRWVGMAFYDTTLGFEFIWDGAAWAGGPVNVNDASGSITAATGFTVTSAAYTTWGGMVSFKVLLVRTGAALGTSSGNITNTLMATISDATLRPLTTISMSTDTSGVSVDAYCDTNGEIYLSALPPAINLNTSDSTSISGTWVRDLV